MTQAVRTEDFAGRMARAMAQADPDLLYFTGYQPIAITERITMRLATQLTTPERGSALILGGSDPRARGAAPETP
jgi:hypothetical protein